MKTVYLVYMSILLIQTCFAQDYKTANAFLKEGKLDKAKTDIDAALIGKDANNPRAWIAKHKIYLAIANSNIYKSTVPDARMQGAWALMKAYKMPHGVEAMFTELGIEYFKPFDDYYTGFISEGSSQLDKGNFAISLENFKSALAVSDFFYDVKLLTSNIDTSMIFYAGYAAMKSNKIAETVFYFKKLCDADAKGTNYNIAYSWLSNYLLKDKKDAAGAKVVCEKGLRYYPNDEYLKSVRIQIEHASGNSENIFNAYEDIISSGKATFSDYLGYGEELYDYLYVIENSPVPNREGKEARMLEVLTKAYSLNNSSAEANYILGMYYSQKTLAIKGTKPQDVKNRNDYANKSVTHLEATTVLYEEKQNLTTNSKEHYKTAIEQLINLYRFKKEDDKAKQLEEKLKTL